MRVRVILHHDKSWRIEKRRWYWPFWTVVSQGWRNFDEAKQIADRIKHPTILELE